MANDRFMMKVRYRANSCIGAFWASRYSAPNDRTAAPHGGRGWLAGLIKFWLIGYTVGYSSACSENPLPHLLLRLWWPPATGQVLGTATTTWSLFLTTSWDQPADAVGGVGVRSAEELTELAAR